VAGPSSPKKKKRNVLLAGATGYIGQYVARELTQRGYRVVAIVRPGDTNSASARLEGLRQRLSGCDVRTARLTDSGVIAEALHGVHIDAVISCIASRSGTPRDAWQVDFEGNRHLLDAARSAGARHFVLLSAICVQRPRLAFQHAKLAFEKYLRESGLVFSIVRPTAFFKSLSGQIERIRKGKPFLVFGDGRMTACKPIGEADLAGFIVDCLEDTDKANRILPIGGPGAAITPLEQGEMLFRLMRRPPRFRHVPVGVFGLAERILAPLGVLLPALQAKAELARIGHYYATESMLLWDEATQSYSADATPSHGTVTLEAFYRRVLSEGLAGQELGEHKLF
jgi:divinyl chlorophyllide a 8-vinyl-reductase